MDTNCLNLFIYTYSKFWRNKHSDANKHLGLALMTPQFQVSMHILSHNFKTALILLETFHLEL